MVIILGFLSYPSAARHSLAQGCRTENRLAAPYGAVSAAAGALLLLVPPPACCRRGYSRNNVAVTAPSAICRSSNSIADERRQDALLRRWVQDHGGFVHESISITSATQCGARGLVANTAISVEQLEESSLVVVPRALHLDNGAAVAAICPQLGSETRQEAFREQLGQLQQVACCLAVERAKGSESFWSTYVNSLPDVPPNPWLMRDTDLRGVLEEMAKAKTEREAARSAHVCVSVEAAARGDLDIDEVAAEPAAAWSAGPGGCRTEWAAAVEVARRRYDGMAEKVLEVVGADSGKLRLDHEGLMWALGQVVSRSLGSGRSSGLLPLIDMANHSSASRPPLMMLDEQDRLVFAVTSIRDGELAPLDQGQELFISYQAEGMSPLQAWLKWGFVPHMLPDKRL